MGNAITNKRHSLNDRLKMSNGLTEAFLHVLVLNGSALATSDGERDLITWLARHDQNVVGRGTVGFDLREMPWSENSIRRRISFYERLMLRGRGVFGKN